MCGGTRSAYWETVAAVVERARRRHERFDPADDAAATAIDEGIRPIVAVYARARRDGVTLSAVERSLLEGVLNDWLAAYAGCLGRSIENTYSIHEVARTCREHGTVADAVDAIVASP
ncbi:hypothetical protein [Halopenitus persicus]|uniref:DUF8055 domain-containing protein n=1 Tax=Halopenitus persicus TaxID=1048396 RepID=A0A1H3DXU2_9EURY|nr:hypothetical protein [Halopenitus persicus]QHS16421.1 hypothetical protein GWK26_04215 [haloarchaeon 3A1-DGR]SDX71303.1 hypothetical protein SAMN05216564_101200 [Halopenitus persicus]